MSAQEKNNDSSSDNGTNDHQPLPSTVRSVTVAEYGNGTQNRDGPRMDENWRIQLRELRLAREARWAATSQAQVPAPVQDNGHVLGQAPAVEPPMDEPPAAEPPVDEPSAAEPPADEPPAAEPPVVEEPVAGPSWADANEAALLEIARELAAGPPAPVVPDHHTDSSDIIEIPVEQPARKKIVKKEAKQEPTTDSETEIEMEEREATPRERSQHERFFGCPVPVLKGIDSETLYWLALNMRERARANNVPVNQLGPRNHPVTKGEPLLKYLRNRRLCAYQNQRRYKLAVKNAEIAWLDALNQLDMWSHIRRRDQYRYDYETVRQLMLRFGRNEDGTRYRPTEEERRAVREALDQDEQDLVELREEVAAKKLKMERAAPHVHVVRDWRKRKRRKRKPRLRPGEC